MADGWMDDDGWTDKSDQGYMRHCSYLDGGNSGAA